MKYRISQFTNEFYQLWSMGLLIPTPIGATTYSVKFRKTPQDEYSRVTLKALSVCDALERACYATTYASPYRPEHIDLQAVYDDEDNLLWIDETYYSTIQEKFEFRGMERREFLNRFGATTAAILFGFRPAQALAGSTSVTLSGTASGFPPPTGEQLYATFGSYTWTVPTGVNSVCVICVGGGGGGGSGTGASPYPGGAGGGGLSYANTIAVTPGATVSVTTGKGGKGYWGTASNFENRDGENGGTSQFGSSTSAPGGTGGKSASNGGSGGTGGAGTNGTGGSGASGGSTLPYAPGGGAAGYSGNGGNGISTGGANGTGGGGGGGAMSGGGGGVGLNGVGSNGVGGQNSSYLLRSGSGGSGGLPSSNDSAQSGGQYGGGGSASYYGYAGDGGSGAVRIIWGTGRSFPSNAT